MSEHKQLDLRPVWDVILDVYQEFAKICKNHNLKFSICAGCMLGAVRHKGFIPWDDDLDVVMYRDDFNRFLDIAEEELPGNMKLVTNRNTKEFASVSCIKIQQTDKAIVDAVEKKIGRLLPQGVFIDIFPHDGYPNTTFGRLWFKFQSAALHSRQRWVLGKLSDSKTLLSKVTFITGSLLWPFFPKLKTLLDFTLWQDHRAQRYDCHKSRFVGWHDAHFFQPRVLVERKYFDDLVERPFDTIFIPMPRNPENYLTALYGADYMTPPPLEKRLRPAHDEEPMAAWKYGPTGM